jgi:hypothetical protein
VHFDSYADLLAEARLLADTPHHTLGNWSLAQILEHLARACAFAVDGTEMRPPWFVRWIARTFLKQRLLTKTLPAGFKVPNKHTDSLVADSTTDVAAALSHLEQQIRRCQEAEQLQPNPVLGQLTRQQWEQFNLRHAEMHLSFVVPDQPAE